MAGYKIIIPVSVIERWQAGEPANALAAELGCHVMTLRLRLKSFPRAILPKTKEPKYHISASFVARYLAGETAKDLADEIGCSVFWMYNRLNEMGAIKAPNRLSHVKAGDRFGSWKIVDGQIRIHKETKKKGFLIECTKCGFQKIQFWAELKQKKILQYSGCLHCDQRIGSLEKDGAKRCCTCREEKPISAYRLDRRMKDGWQPTCKDCHKERAIKEKYGLSISAYREMLDKQKNRCAICGAHFVAVAEGRRTIRAHIDHDHSTGKVRGLLCRNCNWMLGQARDDQSILQRAIAYLSQHSQDNLTLVREASDNGSS